MGESNFNWRRKLTHAVLGLLLFSAAAAAIAWGLQLRAWTWDQTRELRYVPDMQNAWNWGTRAAHEGYWGLYDTLVAEHPDHKYGLDYGPLRLAVMTLWTKWATTQGWSSQQWPPDRSLNAPLLHLNTTMEFLAAAAIFALAFHWLRRDPTRNWIGPACLALLAALFAWFNPASILSAHVRPTWDVWVTPFYLWAVYAACRDRWLIAGCLIGVGVMMKGQLAITAPVFIIWPMITFRIGPAIRWIAGFALAAGLIVAPWQVPLRPGPILFLATMLAIAPVAMTLAKRLSRDKHWPTWISNHLKWKNAAYSAITLTAAALWITPFLFNGSHAWFEVAFRYGADKFPQLEVGGASSMAAILQHRFKWRHDSVVGTLPWTDIPIDITQLLSLIFGGLLLVCCFGMWHAQRRHSPRFLLAMASPWIIYFAIFPRMHERYLLWGAIAACAGIARGVGPALLAILFSLLSTIMSAYQILAGGKRALWLADVSPGIGETLFRIVKGTYPDIGWATTLAALIWLYISVTPSEKHIMPIESRNCVPKGEFASSDSPPQAASS